MSQPEAEISCFDAAVVGSSPLLMMVALERARLGERVALIEKDSQLGGSWAVARSGIRQPSETACHVIEWYSGGYELLEQFSNQRFVPLSPRPKRVVGGKSKEFTSKYSILAGIASHSKRILSAAYIIITIFRHNKDERKRRINIVNEIIRNAYFYLRYKLIGVAIFDTIRAPIGGYAKFVDSIASSLKKEIGVNFIEGNAVSAISSADSIKIEGKSFSIFAKKMYVGESVEICLNNVPIKQSYSTSYHCCIEIKSGDLVSSFSYIHFPRDEYIKRISFDGIIVRNEKENIRALIQMRDCVTQESLKHRITSFLVRERLIKSGAEVHLGPILTKRAVLRRSESGYIKSTDSRVVVLPTVGDLAQSILVARDRGLICKR